MKHGSVEHKYGKEERAVRDTILMGVHKLSQDRSKPSFLLPDASVESIMDMTQKGHLTIIAENLDESFLPSIEKMIEGPGGDVVFTMGPQSISVKALYERCKAQLQREADFPGVIQAKKHFDFGDVLLRMYTEDTAFYKKLNATICGYSDGTTATKEEREMALILNVALHKAGLDKAKIELHKTPEILFRGQGRGNIMYQKKLEATRALFQNGHLDHLDASELESINMVDFVSKKTLSMTTSKDVAHNFATDYGQKFTGDEVVVHIQYPELIADFFGVVNIAALKDEGEFISRFPDDVAMIPVHSYVENGVSHIEVVCLRSDAVMGFQESSRFTSLSQSIEGSIQTLLDHDRDEGLLSMLHEQPGALSKEQAEILEELSIITKKSQTLGDLIYHPEVQKAFLHDTTERLHALYLTNPGPELKAKFDAINTAVKAYTATFVEASVTFSKLPLEEKIKLESRIISSRAGGIEAWLQEKGEKTTLSAIQSDLDILRDTTSTALTKQYAAERVNQILTSDPKLSGQSPALDQAMDELCSSLNRLEGCQMKLSMSMTQSARFALQTARHLEGKSAEPDNPAPPTLGL